MIGAVAATPYVPPIALPNDTATPGIHFGNDNGLSVSLNKGRRMRLPTGAFDLNAALPANNALPANFFGFVEVTLADSVAGEFANTSGGQPEIILGHSASAPATAESGTGTISGGNACYLAYYPAATGSGTANTIQIRAARAASVWWAGTGTVWPKVTPGGSYSICFGQLQHGAVQFLSVVDTKTGLHVTNSPCYSNTSNSGGVGYWFTAWTSATVNTARSGWGDMFVDAGCWWSTSSQNGFGGTIGRMAWVYGDLSLNGGATVDAATVLALSAGTMSVTQAAVLTGMTLKWYTRNDMIVAGTPMTVPPHSSSPLQASASLYIQSGSTTVQTPAGATDIRLGSPAMFPQNTNGLSYRQMGAGYTHRINSSGTPGPTSTGTIYLDGTYGGTDKPSAIQVRLRNASGVVVDWFKADYYLSGGIWRAFIPAVLVGIDYKFDMRWANRTEIMVSSELGHRVGLVLGIWGQSQDELLFSGGANTLAIVNEVASVLRVANGYSDTTPTAPNQTNGPNGHVGLLVLNSTNTPGGGPASAVQNPICDGAIAVIKEVSARSSNIPVMLVPVIKSGHPIDSWVFDHQISAISATASGTTLSTTLASVAPGITGTSGYTYPTGTTGSLVESVAPGSVVITGTGISLTDDGSGNIVGTGGAGTINYATRALALTGLTSGAVLGGHWMSMQDTQAANWALKTALNQFTTTGDGVNNSSGIMTSIKNRLVSPVSALICLQGSANLGEAANYPNGLVSWGDKYNMLRTLLTNYGIIDAQTVVMMGTHFRELSNVTAVDNMRHIHDTLSRGAGTFFGGTYCDDGLWIQGVSSPHEAITSDGAERIGQRIGVAFWAAVTNDDTKIRGPELTSIAFGSSNNILNLTFALPNGGQLTTNSGSTASTGSGPTFTSGVGTDGGLNLAFLSTANVYATGGTAAAGSVVIVPASGIANTYFAYQCNKAITTTTTSPGNSTNYGIADGTGTWSFFGMVQTRSNSMLVGPPCILIVGSNLYRVTGVNTPSLIVQGIVATGASTTNLVEGDGTDVVAGTSTDGLRFVATITDAANGKVQLVRSDGVWTPGSTKVANLIGMPLCSGIAAANLIVDQVKLAAILYDTNTPLTGLGMVPGMVSRPTGILGALSA